jgi:hypothetical protein
MCLFTSAQRASVNKSHIPSLPLSVTSTKWLAAIFQIPVLLYSRTIHATRANISVFLSSYRNTFFLAFDQSAPVFLKVYFYKDLYLIDRLYYP